MVSEKGGGAGVGDFTSGRGIHYRRGLANHKSCKRACKYKASGCIWLFESFNNIRSGGQGLDVVTVFLPIYRQHPVCGIVELWPALRGEWGLSYSRARS